VCRLRAGTWSHIKKIPRRGFMVGATMAAAACWSAAHSGFMGLGANTQVGAFRSVHQDRPDVGNRRVKHIEMGQGSHAGLAAIAEELDAGWATVKTSRPPGQCQALRQH